MHTVGVDEALAKHVRDERRRRGWSAREAASHTAPDKITNTTWSRYENGQTGLTPLIQKAIANAFEWPADWPEHPPEPVSSDLTRRVAVLEAEVESLRTVLRELGGARLGDDPAAGTSRAAPAKRAGRRRASSSPRPSH